MFLDVSGPAAVRFTKDAVPTYLEQRFYIGGERGNNLLLFKRLESTGGVGVRYAECGFDTPRQDHHGSEGREKRAKVLCRRQAAPGPPQHGGLSDRPDAGTVRGRFLRRIPEPSKLLRLSAAHPGSGGSGRKNIKTAGVNKTCSRPPFCAPLLRKAARLTGGFRRIAAFVFWKICQSKSLVKINK